MKYMFKVNNILTVNYAIKLVTDLKEETTYLTMQLNLHGCLISASKYSNIFFF